MTLSNAPAGCDFATVISVVLLIPNVPKSTLTYCRAWMKGSTPCPRHTNPPTSFRLSYVSIPRSAGEGNLANQSGTKNWSRSTFRYNGHLLYYLIPVVRKHFRLCIRRRVRGDDRNRVAFPRGARRTDLLTQEDRK